MIIIGSWNIRGLNSSYKQKMTQQWVAKNNLDLIGMLEPRIQPVNIQAVEKGLGLHGWKFISNESQHPLCRILIGWNTQKVTTSLVSFASQWITCDVVSLLDCRRIRVTMVYAFNTPTQRKSLWNYLGDQHANGNQDSWVVLGDFNATHSLADRHGGDGNWYGHMDDFQNCVHSAELMQIPSKGLHFTWHNGQHHDRTILRKLDWAFANQHLLMEWPAVQANFQARLVSDHSPIVVSLKPDPASEEQV